MVDEKKEKAFIKATIKLFETKTPEEDIKISLEETGLRKEEVEQIFEKAKTLFNETPLEKEAAEFGKKEEKPPENAATEKVKEGKLDFWRKVLENKKEPQEKTFDVLKQEKTFIPKLKTGGKKKIREIVVVSPLESPANEKRKKEKEIPGKKIREQQSEINETKNSSTEIGKEKIEQFKEKTEKKISEIMRQIESEKSFGLDTIEKKIEEKSPNQEKLQQPQQQPFSAKMAQKESNLTMLIIPNAEYNKGMSMLVKKIGASSEKIIYVSLNELYSNLVEHLKNLGIDTKKFFFVDAITLTSTRISTKHDNCIYVTSPNSLVELSLAITQGLNKEKPDVLIFDSISTLLIYEKEGTVTKFIHSLIGKIKAMNIDAYFTALEGDSSSESIKDLTMFVDRVTTANQMELSDFGVPEFSMFKAQGQQKPAKELINEMRNFVPQKNAVKNFVESESKDKNSVVLAEMNLMRKRLEEMQNNKPMQKYLEEISGKISKIENLGVLEKQVKEISRKIEGQEFGSKKEIGKNLLNQISRLEKKIETLEEKLAKKSKEKKQKIIVQKIKQEKPLKEKLEIAEKQNKIQKMLKDLYKINTTTAKNSAAIAKIEKKFVEKGRAIEKAYKKGVIPKKVVKESKERMKKEIKRMENSAKIEKLEKKLELLNNAYDSGVISKKAYLKDKGEIEALLRK